MARAFWGRLGARLPTARLPTMGCDALALEEAVGIPYLVESFLRSIEPEQKDAMGLRQRAASPGWKEMTAGTESAHSLESHLAKEEAFVSTFERLRATCRMEWKRSCTS